MSSCVMSACLARHAVPGAACLRAAPATVGRVRSSGIRALADGASAGIGSRRQLVMLDARSRRRIADAAVSAGRLVGHRALDLRLRLFKLLAHIARQDRSSRNSAPALVISSTCFFRSASSASRIASWNWLWNSDAMRRSLPIHCPTVRSAPGQLLRADRDQRDDADEQKLTPADVEHCAVNSEDGADL